MQRSFSALALAALLASVSGLALAEDGGRGPAGGAFMSSYSTQAWPGRAPQTQQFGAPPSAFALQNDLREPAQRQAQRRRLRQVR